MKSRLLVVLALLATSSGVAHAGDLATPSVGQVAGSTRLTEQEPTTRQPPDPAPQACANARFFQRNAEITLAAAQADFDATEEAYELLLAAYEPAALEIARLLQANAPPEEIIAAQQAMYLVWVEARSAREAFEVAKYNLEVAKANEAAATAEVTRACAIDQAAAEPDGALQQSPDRSPEFIFG